MVLRGILAVLVIGLMTVLPAWAQAQEEAKSDLSLFSFKVGDREPLFGDRFTLKAGYKVWVAKWQAPINLTNSTGPVQITADHPSAMNGPTLTGVLKLRESEWFSSMFVNVTSLRDGFDFQEIGTVGSRSHDFANRRDTSVTAGLAIWEGIGIFAGYYTSGQDFTLYNTDAGTVLRQRRTLQGPLVGIFGSGQVSERVSLYGNAALAIFQLSTGFKSEGSSNVTTSVNLNTNSAQGYATEFGFNFTGPRLWKIGTEFQAGFRAQIINKTFGRDATVNRPGGTIVNDVTYGPIFAINAVF